MLNKVFFSFILLTFIFSKCKSEPRSEKGRQIESNAKGQRDGKIQRDGKGNYIWVPVLKG